MDLHNKPEDHNKIILIDTPKNDHERQRLQQLFDRSLNGIRLQLWKAMSNAGMNQVLTVSDNRDASQWITQLQHLRTNIPSTHPVALNLDGMDLDKKNTIINAFPDAFLYSHTPTELLQKHEKTIKNIDELIALLGSPLQPTQLDTNKEHTLDPNQLAPSPHRLWNRQRLLNTLDTLSHIPQKSQYIINGIAPSFVQCALTCALPTDVDISIVTPSAKENTLPIMYKPIETGTSPSYHATLTDNQYGDTPHQLLELQLQNLDFQTFTAEPALYLPPIDPTKGIIISAAAPIAFHATIARSVQQLGVPWIALYTPQQVNDADNFSPALIIYPKEEIRYIESFPSNTLQNIYKHLVEFGFPDTPALQAQIQQLTQEATTQFTPLLRSYCAVFSAAQHLARAAQSEEEPEAVLALRHKANTILYQALSYPEQAAALLSSLEQEYRHFATFFRTYFQNNKEAADHLLHHRVPHLRLHAHRGHLPETIKAQVAAWYRSSYEAPRNEQLAQKFETTDFVAEDSTHYGLYYSPTNPNPTPENGTLIGYMRSSHYHDPEDPHARYLGNLHIDPAFQGYRLMAPFFGSVVQEEGRHKLIGHTVPNSTPEKLYQQHYGFAVIGPEPLTSTNGEEIYYNHIERPPTPLPPTQ